MITNIYHFFCSIFTGGIVLAAFDQVPWELHDNSVILGCLSFFVALVMMYDLADPMARHVTDMTQTEHDRYEQNEPPMQPYPPSSSTAQQQVVSISEPAPRDSSSPTAQVNESSTQVTVTEEPMQSVAKPVKETVVKTQSKAVQSVIEPSSPDGIATNGNYQRGDTIDFVHYQHLPQPEQPVFERVLLPEKKQPTFNKVGDTHKSTVVQTVHPDEYVVQESPVHRREYTDSQMHFTQMPKYAAVQRQPTATHQRMGVHSDGRPTHSDVRPLHSNDMRTSHAEMRSAYSNDMRPMHSGEMRSTHEVRAPYSSEIRPLHEDRPSYSNEARPSYSNEMRATRLDDTRASYTNDNINDNINHQYLDHPSYAPPSSMYKLSRNYNEYDDYERPPPRHTVKATRSDETRRYHDPAPEHYQTQTQSTQPFKMMVIRNYGQPAANRPTSATATAHNLADQRRQQQQNNHQHHQQTRDNAYHRPANNGGNGNGIRKHGATHITQMNSSRKNGCYSTDDEVDFRKWRLHGAVLESEL